MAGTLIPEGIRDRNSLRAGWLEYDLAPGCNRSSFAKIGLLTVTKLKTTTIL